MASPHGYEGMLTYFLDDYKMKEEYKEAAKKYGSIKVFWKNAFDFEIYEKDINLIISNSGQLIILSDGSDKTDSVKPKHNNTKPSFASYKTQIFSLPKTVMAYIIENANPNILRKLQKLCKYFFILQPHPVCHKFLRVEEESDELKFNGNSLQLPNNFYNKRNEIFNNKFILSNSFLVSKELFLSKFYQCHAKYIRLWSIHHGITIKEFTFLVEHGNVEVLQLSDAPIFNDDKSPVALEEILKLIPKIIEFE
uniref:Uncharacterized protein n=1 Tax=Panagrolaimus davidi TaxID=227884 RepID=A0A914QYU4_9BILA